MERASSSPGRGVARRTIQMLLLTIAVSGANYARMAVGPLQETMRFALALSDNQIALLQGLALALPVVLAAIPIGFVIDRYSRVRLLFILAALTIVGSVLTALASNFFVLFAARCLIGLTATATLTAAASLLADLYAPAQRGRANMVMMIGQTGGGSAVFALGGALLVMFGSGPNGWRWTMFWLTVPLLPITLSMLAMREPRRTGVAVENSSARGALGELWRYRATIAPLIAGGAMVAIADGAAIIWAAPALSRGFGLTPDRIGAIVAMVLSVSGLFGPVAGGTLADFCQRTGGPRRTMLVVSALALLSVPAGFFAVMPNVSFTSFFLVMLITIGNMIGVMFITLFTVVIPNELRGLCLSLTSAIGTTFGLAVAPVSVSLLAGAIGGSAMIGRSLAVVCAVTCLLGAGTFAIGRRYCPRTVTR